jgi:hypothetical protein
MTDSISTTVPAFTKAPALLMQGDAIYLHITSSASPHFWLVARLKALSVLTEYLNDVTDKDERDIVTASIMEMSGECFAFANYCDQNGLNA